MKVKYVAIVPLSHPLPQFLMFHFLKRSLRPLAATRGLLLRGEKGRERRGREGRGKEGRGKG